MASLTVNEIVNTLECYVDVMPQELHNDELLRKRLLNAVQSLVPEVETPAEMSQRLLYTPCEIMGAKIGVDLDVFSTLASANDSVSTSDLAKSSGADEALMLRLLKFMASLGQIKELGRGTWSASNTTRNLASRQMAAGVHHKHDNVMPAWHAIPSWLKRTGYKTPTTKTDTPFAQGHGASPETSFFAWMQQHPWNANEFNLFMHVHRTGDKTWLDRPEVVGLLSEDTSMAKGCICESVETNGAKKIKLDGESNGGTNGYMNGHTNGYAHQANVEDSERAVFVDVGGGIGQQCKALLQKHPEMKGKIILQELPQVIKKANVGPGITPMVIDFFESQPIRGAKSYYLRSIMRNWPDTLCKVILGHIRDVMALDSLVLIDEIVLADVGASKEETQLDMTMLAMLNGGARTDSHWRELLKDAGLQVQDIVFYQDTGREAVIVAKKV